MQLQTLIKSIKKQRIKVKITSLHYIAKGNKETTKTYKSKNFNKHSTHRKRPTINKRNVN